MVSYLDRFGKSPIRSPMDVIKLFNPLSIGQQHNLNRALRALFNFCKLLGYNESWLDGLRKAIPKDRVGVDLRIPDEQEIIMGLVRIRKAPMKYQALWNLCLDSGIRLVEAISVINDFNAGKLHQVNDFYLYEVGFFRGSKQAYYAFFTRSTLLIMESMNEDKIGLCGRISGKFYSTYGVTPAKYLRKFVFDAMISDRLNIPESVADFIEGRVPKTIGAQHYMKLKRQAIQFYPRYAEYITELRRKAYLISTDYSPDKLREVAR